MSAGDGTDSGAGKAAGATLFGVKVRSLAKGLVMMLVLAAGGMVLHESGVQGALDGAWIEARVKGRAVPGEVLFLALGALMTAFGLPRQVVSFLGGYAFGLGAGFVLALLATLLGCLAAFGYARILGRDFVARRFSRRLKRIDGFLRDNPFTSILLIRLLPVGSNLLTNLVAGVTSVRIVPFLLGSLVGYVPHTLIFALLGSGIRLDPEVRVTVSIVLFVASGILGAVLFRRYRRVLGVEDPRDLEEVMDDAPADERGRG